jgi:tRNA(adenine34) deaminase
MKNYNHIFNLNEETYNQHKKWMKYALNLAENAGNEGEVPVGAVIINSQGELIAQGENRKQRDHCATAHAEIIALTLASEKLKTWHLQDYTLYVTLEPCAMCTGAILQARIGLLFYGADDPKTGTIRTVMNLPDSAVSNHNLPVLAGVMEKPCRQQLQRWFQKNRQLHNCHVTEDKKRKTPIY